MSFALSVSYGTVAHEDVPCGVRVRVQAGLWDWKVYSRARDQSAVRRGGFNLIVLTVYYACVYHFHYIPLTPATVSDISITFVKLIAITRVQSGVVGSNPYWGVF